MVLDLLEQLADDSAFVASLKAAAPPPDPTRPAPTESPELHGYRRRRRFRGWTEDRELLAQLRDAWVGKRYPRPGDEGVLVGDRRVVDLEFLPM